jgi:basic membrane protein A
MAPGSPRGLACAVAIGLLSTLLIPTGTEAQGKPKVAFVFVGPVGDAGWTFQHNEARKYLEEALGAETTFVESVPETAEVARVEEQLIQKGFKIIFATAFGYQRFNLEVAKRHPDVHIIGIGPAIGLASNVKTIYGRIWEGRYLTGLVAGTMTKSNIVGFVAANPTPGVVVGINAFALGVWAVNPQAKVKLVWTRAWYDPPKEKAAAQALLDAGVDVIAQHQDSPSPVQAAAEAGRWGIGNNSNMQRFAPKAYLTGTIYDWRTLDGDLVTGIMAGRFQSEDYYGGLAEGLVSLGPFNEAVPASLRSLVEKTRQDIVSGKLQIFKGPLKDQEGTVRVAPGEVMTTKEILSFNWLVQGIEGPSPTGK